MTSRLVVPLVARHGWCSLPETQRRTRIQECRCERLALRNLAEWSCEARFGRIPPHHQ